MRGAIGHNTLLYTGGGVAQLGEHHVRNVGVEGSIPFSSTTFLFLTTNMPQGIEPASGADEQEPRHDFKRSGYLARFVERHASVMCKAAMAMDRSIIRT